MEEKQKILLRKWRARCKRAQIAHNKTAIFHQRLHFIVGGILILLTTTASIITFWKPPADYAWVPLAVVIAATLVAALQTFMRFSEQAEAHRAAARRYGEVKKEIEYVLCFGEALTAIEQRVDGIRAKEVAVGQDAPNALTWHWKRATKDTEEENEQHSIRNQT